MFNLLRKIFIKNYNDTQDERVRSAYGSMAGGVGIVTNILLGALKIVIGILSASVSILSDGINNMSDSASSIITLVGYKISNKKEDEDHPFGHQRVEFISAFLVSVIMLAVGVLLAKESITKIFNPENITFSWITLTLLVISILVKFWQSIFYTKVGKAINSLSLKATAKDSLNDSISTFACLIGIIVFLVFHINIDGYVGVVVAGYIIISAISLIIETSSPLIGEMPPKDERDKYKHKIMSYEGILGVHDMVIHMYGPTKMFITAHAEVSSSVHVNKSHEILDDIEEDFRDNLGIDLTLHLDPVDVDDPETIKTRDILRSKLKEINPDLDIHDFRLVKGDEHTNVLFDIDMPIKINMTKDELHKKASELVKSINKTYIPKIQIDQLYNRMK